MTAADALLLLLGAALTAYALFGGADFGGGFWDLFAGRTDPGAPRRSLIEHTIGPIWEANHVWLIYAVVLLWSGFPSVFASIASTAYIPLTAAALGIIGRGAGFAFRKVSVGTPTRRLFGAGFALSSVATPFFLGTVAGGIASSRITEGIAAGDLVRSWWNPTSIVTGLLAVGVSAYLAAVFLTRDAQRHAPELLGWFRARALGAGAVVGALAVVGLVVVRADAPATFDGLTNGPGLALTALSVLAGLASLALLVGGRYRAVRITASLAVAAVIWAWGAAQYPVLLYPDTTVADAAAAPAVIEALLMITGVGSVILGPSLWWLFHLFQRAPEPDRG